MSIPSFLLSHRSIPISSADVNNPMKNMAAVPCPVSTMSVCRSDDDQILPTIILFLLYAIIYIQMEVGRHQRSPKNAARNSHKIIHFSFSRAPEHQQLRLGHQIYLSLKLFELFPVHPYNSPEEIGESAILISQMPYLKHLLLYLP